MLGWASTSLDIASDDMWRDTVEDKLVQELFDASCSDQLVLGQSNVGLYHEIAKTLSHLTGENYTVSMILKKLNNLHERYVLWDWLNSQRGVFLHPVTKIPEARPEVWEAILKEKPKASMYREQGERHWILLIFIFSGDVGRVSERYGKARTGSETSVVAVKRYGKVKGDAGTDALVPIHVAPTSGSIVGKCNKFVTYIASPIETASLGEPHATTSSTGSSPFPIRGRR